MNYDDPPSDESSDSDLTYPLTPPLSDCSQSRPLSREPGWDAELKVTTIRLVEQTGGRTLDQCKKVLKCRRLERKLF
jgi:hypothetical protein